MRVDEEKLRLMKKELSEYSFQDLLIQVVERMEAQIVFLWEHLTYDTGHFWDNEQNRAEVQLIIKMLRKKIESVPDHGYKLGKVSSKVGGDANA